MDEKENLNNNNQPTNLNNNTSPFDQNTEENPYNNPYFQYNDISNAPYYNANGSDVTLNNDIYNQSYMDVNNSETNKDTVAPATPDNSDMTTNNTADNAVDLFNMPVEPENNTSELQEESSSQHINPILNQSLNNSSEPVADQSVSNVDNTNNFNVPNTQVQPSNDNQLYGLNNDEVQTNQIPNTPIIDNTQSNTPTDNFQFGGAINTNNAQFNNTPELNSQPNNISVGPDNTQFNNPQMETNNLQYNNSNNGFNTQFTDFSKTGATNQILENPQTIGNSQILQEKPTLNNFNMENSQNNSFGSENKKKKKKAWMDTLYEKAQKRKFSIPAFFFGGLYYLFRKVYLFGFIFVLITCIIPIIGLALTASTSNFIFTIIFSLLSLVVGVVYGILFYPIYNKNVNSQLTKLKSKINNPTQLIDTAKQKGGKSIVFLLLGLVVSGIITAIAFSTLLTSIIASLFKTLPSQPNEPDNSNIVAEDPTNIPDSVDTFNFYNDYTLEYDPNSWQENANGVLVSDSYSLAYIQALEGLANYGYDINTPEGRSGFHTYLYNLFSSSIDSTTTTLELGESSFIYEQGIYYSYLDLVYTTSIERCYFVLVPETDTFIEFILSNTDTVISDEIHNQVLTSFTTITNQSEQATENGETPDTTSNTTSTENGESTNNINIENQ